MRMGWGGEGHMLEWHPKWAESQLDEERIVQAWLLGRLRTGVRITSGGKQGGEGTQQHEERRTRGPAIWGAEEEGHTRFTAGSAKMAIAGIRNWKDVSHEEGRWRTWAEMQIAFPNLKGQKGCKKAYEDMLENLYN